MALARAVPVCTIGEAIYDIVGLTHQGHLDTFWTNPTPPEPGVYSAFRRILVDRCLVRGGLASESAVELLIHSILERLRIGEAESCISLVTLESDVARLFPARSRVGVHSKQVGSS